MLRKRPRTKQTKEIGNGQILPTRSNEKVTVQYIQPQSRMAVKSTNPSAGKELDTSHEILEIENVEYLEEVSSADDVNDAEQSLPLPKVEKENEDPFYPNAIYCLLDLYKEKYHKTLMRMNENVSIQTLVEIWRGIAKEMQESYFEFEAEQIQRKFIQLRRQYFDVKTMEDIENLEYFEELHTIYMDAKIDSIFKGHKVDKPLNSKNYNDAVLMNVEIFFQSEEIKNNEHEIIDLEEKEIQAMDRRQQLLEEKQQAHIEEHNHPQSEPDPQIVITEPRSNISQTKPHKRFFHETFSESIEQPVKQKPKLETELKTTENIANQQSLICNEVNDIKQLNAEQERRHREHMALLEKHFQKQTASLEQLNFHLQELIKRMSMTPS
ncbi:uncharacterized protein LOC101890423 [Musca domestica]|uniref:Uncharacterized protein LOC101890423 n=1 Tax=Musca domestica TaxID=7370 RepID=A0A9J7I0Q2_MUSDO|nr:uncharacterized protein LOC101890423 [Musca domestica]